MKRNIRHTLKLLFFFPLPAEFLTKPCLSSLSSRLRGESLRFYFWFFVCSLPACQIFAQTNLSGRVIDAYLQTPLKGVTVTAGNQTVQTGGDGRFLINASGPITELALTQDGYQALAIPLQGWTGEKIITLKPSNLTLPEVLVRAYGADQKLLETPGNLSLLTEGDLDRGDRVNLAPVLNTVAGVRVDQAFMSDSRISLRGEGLRASYGIRNVGIYVDNIPLNEADGYARLEGLDPDILGKPRSSRAPPPACTGRASAGISSSIRFGPRPVRRSWKPRGWRGPMGFTAPRDRSRRTWETPPSF